MYLHGMNYRLTKHGRKRFTERISNTTSDREIIETAVEGLNGYQFVWAPDKNEPNTGRRLVTVLIDKKAMRPLNKKED